MVHYTLHYTVRVTRCLCGARYTVHCTLQWSLWGTMARCLPLLAPPIEEHAPTVIALCRRLEQSNAGLAALARRDAERYGELLRSTHCGGGMKAGYSMSMSCVPRLQPYVSHRRALLRRDDREEHPAGAGRRA